MIGIRSATDVDNPKALSNRMRNRRFQLFEGLFDCLPKPVRIIDIGGTEEFWAQRGWEDRDDVEILAINLTAKEQVYSNIRVVEGDATNLANYHDSEFDIAFSNSVIEHLFTKENQLKMGNEIRRVAKAYWVQTPNYWFPVEPHFHMIGWQWMPRRIRVEILRRRKCGRRGPCPELSDAQAMVDEVRLMSKSEMQAAFPDANIWIERLAGLPKSIVAYRGFSKLISGEPE